MLLYQDTTAAIYKLKTLIIAQVHLKQSLHISEHLLLELAEAVLPHGRSEPEVRSPCKQLERSHQAVLQWRVLGRVSIADLVPKDERIVEDRDIRFLQKITTVRAEKLLIKCFG